MSFRVKYPPADQVNTVIASQTKPIRGLEYQRSKKESNGASDPIITGVYNNATPPAGYSAESIGRSANTQSRSISTVTKKLTKNIADKSSPRSISNASWNKSIVFTSVPHTKSSTTSYQIKKAADNLNTQLGKEFKIHISMRQSCERAAEEALKEYNILTHTIAASEEALIYLKDKYDDHEALMKTLNALPKAAIESPSRIHIQKIDHDRWLKDPHHNAFKVIGDACTPIDNSDKQKVIGVDDKKYYKAKKTNFVELDKVDGNLLLDRIKILKHKINGARQLQQDMSISNDRVQHLINLINSALRLDMVCMGQDIDDQDIVVNTSTVFPNMKLSDLPQVLEKSANLAAFCTRVSVDMRKVILGITGRQGHSETAKVLHNAIKFGLKCTARKKEEAERAYDSLDMETKRIGRLMDNILDEQKISRTRLLHLEKVRRVRISVTSSLDTDIALDHIYQSVMTEVASLEGRLSELESQMKTIEMENDRINMQKKELAETIEECSMQEDICQKQERLLKEH